MLSIHFVASAGPRDLKKKSPLINNACQLTSKHFTFNSLAQSYSCSQNIVIKGENIF